MPYQASRSPIGCLFSAMIKNLTYIMTAMRILDTERLTLRVMTPNDADFYLELINDPTWIKNIRDMGIHSVEAARESILTTQIASQNKDGFSFYLVSRQSDNVAMGICGMKKRDYLDHVDIGYAFLPRYAGNGYAFEAASAVVQYARTVLLLPRLVAITSPGNQRSNQLLKKLGFNLEKVLILPGEERDTNLYGLTFTHE
jgi:RimJ/RimL family protein N-acetyltransferase